MKTTLKLSRKAGMFKPGEHVRVVPLYHPKPSVPIDELARARASDQDLFDGQPHPAPTGAHLAYQGGALIRNVQIYTIFWGTLWGSNASSQQMMANLNQFFTAVVVSPLLDQLAEYNVAGQAIGHGAFLGTQVISANAPSGSISDSAVQAQLLKWIKAKTVPKNTANTLYFIYLDPGVVSVLGGSKSCQNYCDYHNNTGKVYYAVMPYPTCTGCLGGMQAFEALTATSSHEMCGRLPTRSPALVGMTIRMEK